MMPKREHHRSSGNHHHHRGGMYDETDSGTSTPICRCRVLYLGSAVPHITKDGLQGIQQPLKELYPSQGASSAKGIDSWLSVWSNGLLLENVDEKSKKITRFFPIESLHYCAAVRYVIVSGGGSGTEKVPRFLPLDSPFAKNPNITHPPIFACILRRTTGIKVLECHAFICKRETPANALVRCCFHAYADNMYARQLEGGGNYGTVGNGPVATQSIEEHLDISDDGQSNGHLNGSRSELINGDLTGDELSIFNGDENHKVWAGVDGGGTLLNGDSVSRDFTSATLRSIRSTTSSRPRQLSHPAHAPPPPEFIHSTPQLRSPGREHHSKKKKGKSPGRRDLTPLANGYQHMNGGPASPGGMGPMMNGHSPPRPRPHSANNGYAIMTGPPRGTPVFYGPPPPAPVLIQRAPPLGPMPATMIKKGKKIIPAMLPPLPLFIPSPGGHLPGHPMAPVHMAPMISPRGRPPSRVHEEPATMPSGRPLSPIASYQPGHFPHEDYYFQYATTERPQKYKRKLRKMREGSGMLVPAAGHPPQFIGSGGPPTPAGTYVEENPFGTGIYKKKGERSASLLTPKCRKL